MHLLSGHLCFDLELQFLPLLPDSKLYMHFPGYFCIDSKLCMHFLSGQLCFDSEIYVYFLLGEFCFHIELCMHFLSGILEFSGQLA